VVRLSRALNPSSVLKPGNSAPANGDMVSAFSACALGKSAKPASTSGMTSRVVVLSFINEFMIWFFLSFSPLSWFSAIAGPDGAKNLAGRNVLGLIQIRLTTSSLEKITSASQANSPQPRVADSSSTNAVNFSSARTTNRFPSLRCASAIQIVRPLESIAETQPQLQPALLRLSAMISQHFTHRIVPLLPSTRQL
jgi:hypothetical protein